MRIFRKSSDTTTGRQPRHDLQGQRPATSMSYHSRRADQEANTGRQQPREQRQPLPGARLRFWLQRFGLIVLLMAITASVLDLLYLSPHSQIKTLGNTDITLLHSRAQYQAAADRLLAGNLADRNKLTVNSAALATALKRQFPELSAVTVTVPLLAHQPVVYIQPAQPALILLAANGPFVIDDSGMAVLSVPDTTKLAALRLPQVLDQSALTLRPNQQALPAASVSFIRAVVDQLAAKQLGVAALTLPAGSSELDVSLVGQSYVGKFNLASDTARQQTGTFLATKAYLESRHSPPAAYIDVRVSGRAYYK